MADFQAYLPWIITAAIVLLALVLLFLVLGMFQKRVRGKKGSRLGVSEYYELDKMRRLVLIRRDGTEHLLMIGGDQDLVIETGISDAVESAIGESRRSRLPMPAEERSVEPELTRPAPPTMPREEPLRTPVVRATRPAPRPAVFGDRRIRSSRGAAEPAEPRLGPDDPAREQWENDEPDQSSR